MRFTRNRHIAMETYIKPLSASEQVTRLCSKHTKCCNRLLCSVSTSENGNHHNVMF